MPWCPKCRNEYREGFTECADCKVPLVAELEEINEPENDTAGLYYDNAETFEGNSGEESTDFEAFDPETLNEQHYTDAKAQEKELRKYFMSVKDPSVYESKKFKAEEFSGSGYMLIAIGACGLLLTFLNVAGVLNFIAKGFSTIMMFCMFAAMIIGGVMSIKSSKKYEEEAVEEDKLTDYILGWFKQNITAEELARVDEPGNTSEENFLLRTEHIKSRLINANEGFDTLNDNYIDSLIEEFYNENIESQN